MLEPGDPAPPFSLPGTRREEIGTFSLSDYEGRIVVLAFYPMDFSPVCEEELRLLRDMELFSLSDAVELLAVSGDSAYAHRAFAREFDLDFPLLSDRTGNIAAQYGVLADELEGHENVPHRSVFVIDTQRTIRYAWTTEDPSVVPDTATIKDAVESIRDDAIAREQFEDGRSKFRYGRSEFDAGTDALEAGRLELAVETFGESVWYFEEASAAFGRTGRYAENEELEAAAEVAERKARRFRQSAEWFCEAAERSAEESTPLAMEIRSDAEDALEEARQYPSIDDLYHPE